MRRREFKKRILLQVSHSWPRSVLQENHWCRGDGHWILWKCHSVCAHRQTGEILWWKGKILGKNFEFKFLLYQLKNWCINHATAVLSVLKGGWLLHVSHRWLRGGRCHRAWQRCPLHQPLMRAKLLLSGHHRGRPEAHRHLCLSAYLLWRGAHLRLQVPYWGCQQQAALQLRRQEVSQVPQLISKHFKEDCKSVEQRCHNVPKTPPPARGLSWL